MRGGDVGGDVEGVVDMDVGGDGDVMDATFEEYSN